MKLYNSKVVARWLDISERRVRQLRDEKIISEKMPGLYDLMPTVINYINYIRDRNPDSKEAVNYTVERAKLMRAKRLNEEYDLQLKEGTLHSSDDIKIIVTSCLISFKTKLTALASKLSPLIAIKNDKEEIFKILKESHDEALNEFSDLKNVFEIEGSGEETEVEDSESGETREKGKKRGSKAKKNEAESSKQKPKKEKRKDNVDSKKAVKTDSKPSKAEQKP